MENRVKYTNVRGLFCLFVEGGERECVCVCGPACFFFLTERALYHSFNPKTSLSRDACLGRTSGIHLWSLCLVIKVATSFEIVLRANRNTRRARLPGSPVEQYRGQTINPTSKQFGWFNPLMSAGSYIAAQSLERAVRMKGVVNVKERSCTPSDLSSNHMRVKCIAVNLHSVPNHMNGSQVNE